MKVDEQGWIQGRGVAKPPSEKNHHFYDRFPYELAIYCILKDEPYPICLKLQDKAF